LPLGGDVRLEVEIGEGPSISRNWIPAKAGLQR